MKCTQNYRKHTVSRCTGSYNVCHCSCLQRFRMHPKGHQSVIKFIALNYIYINHVQIQYIRLWSCPQVDSTPIADAYYISLGNNKSAIGTQLTVQHYIEENKFSSFINFGSNAALKYLEKITIIVILKFKLNTYYSSMKKLFFST